MRVRSERHDQALNATKTDYEIRLETITDQFARDAEADSHRHRIEIERCQEESMTRLSLSLDEVNEPNSKLFLGPNTSIVAAAQEQGW